MTKATDYKKRNALMWRWSLFVIILEIGLWTRYFLVHGYIPTYSQDFGIFPGLPSLNFPRYLDVLIGFIPILWIYIYYKWKGDGWIDQVALFGGIMCVMYGLILGLPLAIASILVTIFIVMLYPIAQVIGTILSPFAKPAGHLLWVLLIRPILMFIGGVLGSVLVPFANFMFAKDVAAKKIEKPKQKDKKK